jgi:protein-S-isoprenylcysteine O-methyltransferase Ste14
MDILRLALFLGLIAHKLVWERLNRRIGAVQNRPRPAPSYRKQFVKAGKALFLLFLVLQTLFLNVLPISDQPVLVSIVGALLYAIGLATALIGRIQLGDNWTNIEDAKVTSKQLLVSNGIYRYIRHPIYAGDVLLIVGLELALNSWLVVVSLIPLAVIVRQALAEESLLSRSIPGYNDYLSRTRRFIPFIL